MVLGRPQTIMYYLNNAEAANPSGKQGVGSPGGLTVGLRLDNDTIGDGVSGSGRTGGISSCGTLIRVSWNSR